MMVDCCAADPTSCTALKAQFPQLASNSSDVNPDYCYMHGNVCSRCRPCGTSSCQWLGLSKLT
jgi:hypothetical protein